MTLHTIQSHLGLSVLPGGSRDPTSSNEILRKAAGEYEERGDVKGDTACKLIVHDLTATTALLDAVKNPDIINDADFIFIMFNFVNALMHR